MSNIYIKNENSRKTSKLYIGLRAETYSKDVLLLLFSYMLLLFVVNKADYFYINVNQ